MGLISAGENLRSSITHDSLIISKSTPNPGGTGRGSLYCLCLCDGYSLRTRFKRGYCSCSDEYCSHGYYSSLDWRGACSRNLGEGVSLPMDFCEDTGVKKCVETQA